MKALLFLALASIISAATLTACTGTSAGPVTLPGPPKTMKAFASEEELTKYLKKLAEAQRLRRHTVLDNVETKTVPSEVAGVANYGVAAKSAEPAQETLTRSTLASMKATSSSCTAIIS